MLTSLLVFHVILAVSLVGLVLIQKGKGAEVGASFGSGASQTVFGSQGSVSFLTRATGVIATLFFITSLTLAYFSVQKAEMTSVTDISVTDTSAPMTEEEIEPFVVDQSDGADVPQIEPSDGGEILPADVPAFLDLEETPQ